MKINQVVFGVDIGGTNIKIGLFSYPERNLIIKKEVETPKANQNESLFELIFHTINELALSSRIDMSQVLGIGVAVPCPVNGGCVGKCPNLAWDNMDIRDKIIKYFPKHIKVEVANDANAAALGENESLEKPYNNAILITLGTGVGGGIIINHKIHEGSSGMGGEIGHMFVFEGSSETCGCGSNGCFEQVCGTKGILNYAKELSLSHHTSIQIETITVKDVFDAAKQDDFVGKTVIERVAFYIAKSASILAVTLDPEVFIIGGGISKAGQFLIDLITNQYKKMARFTSGEIPFILAHTGNDAGIIGSAHLI